MIKKAHHESYDKYVEKQKEKTLDPDKREKWLTVEWQSKIDGFKNEFKKFGNILNQNSKVLCIGARTGQEVEAFIQLGIKNVMGIDLVACPPHVIEGDMHKLSFADETFDIVYSNIFDHSTNPAKFVSEIERVLKINGFAFMQFQLGIDQDEYTEYIIENPFHDILTLFNVSYCHHINSIERNFAGMNFEILTRKDAELVKLFNEVGTVETLKLPDEYRQLWDDINLDTQKRKLDSAFIVDENERNTILDTLSKRAYYLTKIADTYGVKQIAEVGTAEGWQFYSFCKSNSGNVWSCDLRDVRSSKYVNTFENEKFVVGNSDAMRDSIKEANEKIDMFYIDGGHDQGNVVADVKSLIPVQSDQCIWVFDDFDTRFGCVNDIAQILVASTQFKVYSVGKTASGQPNHQAFCRVKFTDG